MICGIDETGDFDPNSKLFNYFVAVHIDQNQNKYSIKQSQFNIWEGSIPERFKTKKGEVKGQNLFDTHLDTFYKEVIDSIPRVQYSVLRVIPFENPPEILEKHKKFEIQSIEKAIQESNIQKHMGWVNAYQQILFWYKNKNYQVLLKMKCLEELLGISFHKMIIWAQFLYLLDEEYTILKDIQFKIDKDFIKSDNVKLLWNELFRQFWQEFTKKKPLPVVMPWKQVKEHPFFKVYYGDSGQTNLKRIFRKNTNFLDSQESWEIRMADILGTILHRHQNKNKCEETGKKILKRLSGKYENFEHLILNDVPGY